MKTGQPSPDNQSSNAGLAAHDGAEVGPDRLGALSCSAHLTPPQAALDILPYLNQLRAILREKDKLVIKTVNVHPLWLAFGKSVRGMGPINFAQILGEIGDRQFAGPAKLWFYFGLGRYMDENQHRTRDVEKAKQLRYCVPRRVMMYNVADCLIKLNKEEYRAVYDSAKQAKLEQGWTRGHAHMHGHRLTAKRLLRNLWRELKAVPSMSS